MKLSVNWLRELVDFPDDVELLCERLTLMGLEVEAVDPFELSFPNVVVGHVLNAEKHPDADKLRVCRVSVGGEELDIVCGAPNVREGLKVVVAQVGAVLPGNFKIKKSKIRGQVSMGMICSEKELGLGEGHEGILELDASAQVGRPVDELFGVRDTVFEIEVTPNRPDWLSHLGVAREIGAHYGSAVRLPEVADAVETTASDGDWKIRIDDPSGCRRFSARLVDGVRVGPSPLWLRQRLLSIGQRPINAVVDASNLVLHECGHPNHCFDRAKLHGETVILRRANAGEHFTTLDETERELGSHHLLVADREGGIALAGIMGGHHSEVDEATRDLLLEVAVFDPRTIRQGRRSVGLSTDASYRFERGVDFEAVPWVSRRLTRLIQEVAGGTAHSVVLDAIGKEPVPASKFFVRAPQVQRLLGVEVSAADMGAKLAALDIPVVVSERDGVPGVEVTAPSFRHDLHQEVDAIEEIARLHGFDRLAQHARPIMAAPARIEPAHAFARRVRQDLAARGFHEVMGSSFQPEAEADSLGLAADDSRRQGVRVLNPVVHDEAMLKTTAVGEMVRFVERNRRRGHTGPIRLFQIARCFRGRQDAALPEESQQLLVAWSGPIAPLHPDTSEKRDVDLYDALGELDAALDQWAVRATRAAGRSRTWIRTGTCAGYVVDDAEVGVVGEVAPPVRRALDADGVVFVAEFDLSALLAARRDLTGFAAFSAYPPVRRDLSLVVPTATRWAEVVSMVRESLGPLLDACDLFDVFEGEGLPPSTRALGLRLSLRSASGTLKDKKVDAMLSKLLDGLRSTHQIRLRSEVEGQG